MTDPRPSPVPEQKEPTDARWITFREIPASGVTKRWEIVTKQSGAIIGWIAWSNGWRRYVLQPDMLTEWEQDCLRDVASFLELETSKRKIQRLVQAERAGTLQKDAANVK